MVVAGSCGSFAEVAREVRSQSGASTVSKQEYSSLLLVSAMKFIGNLFDLGVREFCHNSTVILKIAVRVGDRGMHLRAARNREDLLPA
jgi:hypothetical protein